MASIQTSCSSTWLWVRGEKDRPVLRMAYGYAGMQPSSETTGKDEVWRQGRREREGMEACGGRGRRTGSEEEDLGGSAGVAWKRRKGLSPRLDAARIR